MDSLTLDKVTSQIPPANKSRPTILVIGPTPPPYHGVSSVVSNVLESSLRDSFRILHLDTADRRSLANVGNLDFTNILLALGHALHFQYLLFTERPQLVYTSIAEVPLGFLRDSLFLVPARLAGRAVVVHLHGGHFDSFYQESNAVLQALIRFCLFRVDRAIVLGERFRHKFAGLVDDSKIRVVPNGISIAGYDGIQKQAQPQGTYRVLFMGNLIRSKGFGDFIHAAPIVLEQMKDVEFQLVGDDSFAEAQEAKEWVRSNGLEGKVKFLGVRHGTDKQKILQSADLLIFPTCYAMEGQPMVLLESMAARVPIITTRHATIEDTLGADGALYVNQADPVDIAEKIISLLRDAPKRQRIASNNWARVSGQYTVDKFATNLGMVLREALDSKDATHG